MVAIRSQSLLLVEDDPNDILFFRRGLEKSGVSTTFLRVAQDGQEAVAYLEGRGRYENRAEHPLPALIVLDLKLPRKSGLEVLEWLRKDPHLKDLPVIILTSSKEPTDMARAKELGVAAYHVKPVDFKDLCELVASFGESWLKLADAAIALETE